MNKFQIPSSPINMILNTDSETVNNVVNALATKTNGYCPCVPKYRYNDDTKCPCKEAREKQICLCKLFIKVK